MKNGVAKGVPSDPHDPTLYNLTYFNTENTFILVVIQWSKPQLISHILTNFSCFQVILSLEVHVIMVHVIHEERICYFHLCAFLMHFFLLLVCLLTMYDKKLNSYEILFYYTLLLGTYFCTLSSVRLWNFFKGGSKLLRTQKKSLYFVNTMT